MKKVTYSVSTSITFEFDEQSDAVQRALSSFQELISSTGTMHTLLSHVAYSISKGVGSKLIEGVGYVMIHGSYSQDAQQDDPALKSGIDVVDVVHDIDEAE